MCIPSGICGKEVMGRWKLTVKALRVKTLTRSSVSIRMARQGSQFKRTSLPAMMQRGIGGGETTLVAAILLGRKDETLN